MARFIFFVFIRGTNMKFIILTINYMQILKLAEIQIQKVIPLLWETKELITKGITRGHTDIPTFYSNWSLISWIQTEIRKFSLCNIKQRNKKSLIEDGTKYWTKYFFFIFPKQQSRTLKGNAPVLSDAFSYTLYIKRKSPKHTRTSYFIRLVENIIYAMSNVTLLLYGISEVCFNPGFWTRCIALHNQGFLFYFFFSTK